MTKFIMNLKDKSGCIRTGYEEVLECETEEEAINEYLHYIIANEDETATRADIDCEEVTT